MVRSKHSKHRLADSFFVNSTAVTAFLVLLVMSGMIVMLAWNSRIALKTFGFSFFTSSDWNPAMNTFGAFSSIYGTIVSTVLALVVAVPMSVMIALFLVEFAPKSVSTVVGGAIELLAAVPSIIYGMWGMFVLAPIMSEHIQPFLADKMNLAGIPVFGKLFQGPPMGIGMLTAGIILAIMVLPYISMVMRDVFMMVPSVIKESAYGMGSTTWEVTHKITLRYGIQGVIGAVFLGLGRAIGETMAVTFVIGNAHQISSSLYAPGTSIASTIANEFGEATDPVYMHSLILLGLTLLVMTLVIQIFAQLWMRYIKKKMGAGL
ncbi:MAG TPA: phosphate ABC transporter permease subunit PstC [bacterium]|nr:phosphate ABC transporter permease subunit PstC [bacterium]HPS29614.1 phosphate ABC transporter permease subunit PstC [bacterium]